MYALNYMPYNVLSALQSKPQRSKLAILGIMHMSLWKIKWDKHGNTKKSGIKGNCSVRLGWLADADPA